MPATVNCKQWFQKYINWMILLELILSNKLGCEKNLVCVLQKNIWICAMQICFLVATTPQTHQDTQWPHPTHQVARVPTKYVLQPSGPKFLYTKTNTTGWKIRHEWRCIFLLQMWIFHRQCLFRWRNHKPPLEFDPHFDPRIRFQKKYPIRGHQPGRVLGSPSWRRTC